MATNLKTLKGAIHLHTDLSHDGTMPMEKLASFLKSKGYDFMAITEHSYDVDGAAMRRLADEAASLSSDKFTIIPGIEFRCHHDIDIMGFGVIETCDYDDPLKVIEHIHNFGGVAVWAHPSHRDYPFEKQWLERLDGAEIWNQIHDSRYMPKRRSIDRFNNLVKSAPNLSAFCGLDLHIEKSFFFMSTNVAVKSNSRAEILDALRSGSFTTKSRFFRLNSAGTICLPYYLYISVFNRWIKLARRVRDRIFHE